MRTDELIAIVAKIILNIYFAILVFETKFRCQSIGRDDIWIGSYGVQRIHPESTLNKVQSEFLGSKIVLVNVLRQLMIVVILCLLVILRENILFHQRLHDNIPKLPNTL